MPEGERMMTPKEFARALRVHVRTVRRWIADGVIPVVRIKGTVRIPASALTSKALEEGEK